MICLDVLSCAAGLLCLGLVFLVPGAYLGAKMGRLGWLHARDAYLRTRPDQASGYGEFSNFNE